VSVITIGVEFFPAFSDGQIIIVPAGSSYIKEVRSSFPSTNALAVDAVHSFFIVFVRHFFSF
jgi:hypothetical protein